MRTKTNERTMKTIKDDTIKRINLLIALAGIALVLVLSTGASAQDKSDEAKMNVRETSIGTLQFNLSFPTEETSKLLKKERRSQRAIQTYIWAIPIA